MSFAPVYDDRSRALILGTWPSPKSREMAFYYGHPQNRFWPLLAALTGEPLPVREDIAAKKPYLAPSLLVWVAFAVLHLSPRRAFCSPCPCRAKGVKSTRAPPYSLLLYK